jgi:hypothetical protein
MTTYMAVTTLYGERYACHNRHTYPLLKDNLVTASEGLMPIWTVVVHGSSHFIKQYEAVPPGLTLSSSPLLH